MDYDTRIPVLKKHREAFDEFPEEVSVESSFYSGCEHKARCLYKYNTEKLYKETRLYAID